MSQANYSKAWGNLCDEVEKLDSEAAKYLREAAPNLPLFVYDADDKAATAYLDVAFVWHHTPQGSKYWGNLYNQLRQVVGPAEVAE